MKVGRSEQVAMEKPSVASVRLWVTPKRFGIYEHIITMWRAMLDEVGVESFVGENEEDDRSLHLVMEPLSYRHRSLPPFSLLMNTEPLSKFSPDSDVYGSQWKSMLCSHHIIDYSQRNIGQLNAECPGPLRQFIGYGFHPSIQDMPESEPAYDVVFVGAMTPRRERIIRGLRERGLSVDVVTKAFGEELSARIAAARLLVNIHAHSSPRPVEIVRLLHPLANGKLVLSERNAQTEVPAYLEDSMLFADARALPQTASDLLSLSGKALREIAERKSSAFRQYDGRADFLRALARVAAAGPAQVHDY